MQNSKITRSLQVLETIEMPTQQLQASRRSKAGSGASEGHTCSVTCALAQNSKHLCQLGCGAPNGAKSDHFSHPEKPASPLPKHPRPIEPATTPDDTMFLQRSAVAVARRAAVAPVLRRSIATTAVRRKLCPRTETRPGSRAVPEKTHRHRPTRSSPKSRAKAMPPRPRRRARPTPHPN